jgi:hypothetical protein
MIEPLFNGPDEEWVALVGKYILNMGSVEATTRMLISLAEQSDLSQILNADLPSRLGYLRRRFPRDPTDRHSWAMNVFTVAAKHVSFRNIVAHSPIIITGHADGSLHIQGILNITPNNSANFGEFVRLPELRGRVDESAVVGRDLLAMQRDFRPA